MRDNRTPEQKATAQRIIDAFEAGTPIDKAVAQGIRQAILRDEAMERLMQSDEWKATLQ